MGLWGLAEPSRAWLVPPSRSEAITRPLSSACHLPHLEGARERAVVRAWRSHMNSGARRTRALAASTTKFQLGPKAPASWSGEVCASPSPHPKGEGARGVSQGPPSCTSHS